MKKLFKYGLILFAAVFMPMLFQSCKDDKDIVIIDEDTKLRVVDISKMNYQQAIDVANKIG